jgi:cysteine desulfurase
MQRNIIYFDNNATAILLPAVREAMLDVMVDPLNASSVHHFGRNAKLILETARNRIMNFSGADQNYHAIFTASGTEGNNLAIKGLPEFKIITTAIEHTSVLSVGEGLIPVDGNGVVDLSALEAICARQNGKFLVSIMAANNETGAIQPIREAAALVHKHGGIIHSDATQSFGKVDFNVCDLGLDMVTISAHKLGGPLGAAALIARKNLELTPIMFGGGQELRYRPGTQNIPAIHGFGVATELAPSMISDYRIIKKIRDYIQEQIRAISPASIVFSEKADRLPNTLSITMPDIPSETQVIHFDINGFAVSAGSACSSGRVDIPYVQMAMGYDEAIARTSLRISLGISNTIEEADLFIKAWRNLFLNSKKNSNQNIKTKAA